MYIEAADANILVEQVRPMVQMAMQRRNTTLTIALCVSLTAHALVLWALCWWFVHYTPPPKLAALVQPDDAPIIITSRRGPRPPSPKSPPLEKPKPPPPPDFSKALKQPPHDDSGEAGGKGTANRSTAGDQPMQAAQGLLEQADLTRSAKEDDLDKSRLEMPAQAGVQTNDEIPVAPPPKPQFGVAQSTPTPAKPIGGPPLIAIADPTKPGATGSSDAKSTPPTPAPKQINGHIANSSDTESMPFAKANSASFRNGKMESRDGRKVKTTRIQLGLAGEADAASLVDPSVVLGVTVDATGNVQNVIVLRSSGSNNIDQPYQRAVYNWWFEPSKDKEGRPLADQWVVTID
jgi:protein TonB